MCACAYCCIRFICELMAPSEIDSTFEACFMLPIHNETMKKQNKKIDSRRYSPRLKSKSSLKARETKNQIERVESDRMYFSSISLCFG